MNIKKFSIFFCSGFGIGFFPFFPGSIASAFILPLFWFVKLYFSISSIIIGIIIYYIISFFLLKLILIDEKNMDPKYVVCDEYIGQSLALLFCEEEIIDYLIAFILFRILDISKPFPISYFDKSKTVNGVLMDDLVAGLIVGIIFYIYYAI